MDDIRSVLAAREASYAIQNTRPLRTGDFVPVKYGRAGRGDSKQKVILAVGAAGLFFSALVFGVVAVQIAKLGKK